MDNITIFLTGELARFFNRQPEPPQARVTDILNRHRAHIYGRERAEIIETEAIRAQLMARADGPRSPLFPVLKESETDEDLRRAQVHPEFLAELGQAVSRHQELTLAEGVGLHALLTDTLMLLTRYPEEGAPCFAGAFACMRVGGSLPMQIYYRYSDQALEVLLLHSEMAGNS